MPTTNTLIKVFCLISFSAYCGFAQDTVELTFCDEDNDGYITFNVQDLTEQVIGVVGLENSYYLERILVSTSAGSVIAIDNPSTNPYLTPICSGPFSSLDVAVDKDQNIYTTRLLRILDDCDIFVYSGGTFWQANALSFDDLNQMYAGYGIDSHVYRFDNLTDTTVGNLTIWHDFGTGTSGGDFVLFNEKIYVSWKTNAGVYKLYEVTVDANRNYISHIDLGQLPNKTYGLAKEYDKIYGITPTKLYQIHLEDFSFTDVFENPNPETEWYGAAGLHEALNFNTSLHETFDDAQANANWLQGEWSNTVYGGQVIFLRIENTLTGEVDIVNVNIVIFENPAVNIPENLENCYTDDYNFFDLNEVTNQMRIDNSQNLEFTYYDSNPLTDASSPPIALNYQPFLANQFVFVKVENLDGGCSLFYPFNLVSHMVPSIAPLYNIDEPRELTNCYLDSGFSGYFDLSEIESTIVLDDLDYYFEYYLSHSDAELAINPISELYYLELPSQEIFIRVEDENGCYAVSNFFISRDCIINNVSTDFVVFPKFITPNEDSFNDYWNVKGISERLRRESMITIFDRYGKLLISFRPNSTAGWDGTVNGELMPTDDYWVLFQTNSGFTKAGHFTLKR